MRSVAFVYYDSPEIQHYTKLLFKCRPHQIAAPNLAIDSCKQSSQAEQPGQQEQTCAGKRQR